jgi:hypothetical protein
MQYIIMTSDRPVNYLAETLLSFEQHVGEPVHLSHGSPTISNLPEDVYSPQFPHTVHILQDMDKEPFLTGSFPPEKVLWSNHHLVSKSTLNYIQALMLSEDDCCIFEDDVLFSSQTKQILAKIANHKHIVALYHCYDFPSQDLLAKYPIHDFYGTQGMYVPGHLRNSLASYMKEHLGEQPYDFLIKTFLLNQGEQLFALRKCIVQHTGTHTTGLGHHHQTNHFLP